MGSSTVFERRNAKDEFGKLHAERGPIGKEGSLESGKIEYMGTHLHAGVPRSFAG